MGESEEKEGGEEDGEGGVKEGEEGATGGNRVTEVKWSAPEGFRVADEPSYVEVKSSVTAKPRQAPH